MGVETRIQPQTIVDIYKKWLHKSQNGKGIQLDADAVALLNAMGIGNQLAEAAADFMRDQCQKRVARSHSINGGNSNSSPDPDEITKSSGTTPPESGKDALARARRMNGAPGPL